MSDFVHLHLHSEYSLLDGACRIEELLDKAVELKMPAMAITEHGNMFSSVIFHDQARKRGINPILGCEVYVAPGDRRVKSGTPGETANHLVLLAETNEGYHNLIQLVSAGYTDGFYYKPRIGTGKTVNDTERLKYHGDQFYLKTAAEMLQVFPDHTDAIARTARIAARCNVDLSFKENYLPNFDVPAGFTLDEYFEHVVRQGFDMRLSRLKDLQAKGALAHTIDEYERRLTYE